jgi:predicted transcriptional regulator
VAFGDGPDETRRRMRLLMDTIPTLTRPVSVRQLAQTVGLPEETVAAYLARWRDKGLIELRP